MNPPRVLLVLLIWSVTELGVQALEPSKVDGVVDVQVDRSKPIWAVKVTNHSKEELRYEMMGKVPRGLALELWDVDGDHHLPRINAVRVHAEDLAHMNVDGFPADIRSIAPGGSATFALNPKSMSTTDDLALAKWERAKRNRYYTCRVAFGIYASRMMDVGPMPKAKKEPEKEEKHPIEDRLRDLKDEEPFGFQIRRMLNMEGLALVEYTYGTDAKGEKELTLTTCSIEDFSDLAALDVETPPQVSMHELIAKAGEMAREKHPECAFEGLMINPCEDDPTKFYASLYFSDDHDHIGIDLLMNGEATKTITFAVSDKQYDEISKFRIPRIQQKEKTNKAKVPDRQPEP